MPFRLAKEYWSKKYIEILGNHLRHKELLSEKYAENSIDLSEKIFGSFSGKKVLDFGAGYGRNTFPIAKKGADVYALEIAPAAINLISMQAKNEHINNIYPKLIDANSNKIDFEDEFFDLIFVFSVIDYMHINIVPSIIKEFKRILKKGGGIVATFDPENINFDKSMAIHQTDGSWLFVSGPESGKIWKPYKENEIKFLFKDFEIIKFVCTTNGIRKIFAKKTN